MSEAASRDSSVLPKVNPEPHYQSHIDSVVDSARAVSQSNWEEVLTAEDDPCDVEIASIDFNGRLEFVEFSC